MRAHHAAKTQFRLPNAQIQTRAALSLAAALALVAGALFVSRGSASAPLAQQPQLVDLTLPSGSVDEIGQWCVDHNTASFRATLTTNGRNVLRGCVELWGAGKTPSPTPSPTVVPTSPSPSMSPTPSQPPTPSPSVTQTTPAPTSSPSPTAVPTPTPSPSPTGGWPGPNNTGVPAGVTLTPYTGPCTIVGPVAATIDAKLISCDLDIRVSTTITRSWISDHTVNVDTSGSSTTPLLSISDSLLAAPKFVINQAGQHQGVTALADGLFVATRVEITGGNRGVLCAWYCTLQDSWVHGTYVEADWHASAVRAERYSTIVHNTLNCSISPPTPQDGGCSADLTGYPDFAPPHDWLIANNLFVANVDAAFCAYGGSSGPKPYSSDPMTGVNIVFRDNVFQRGPNRQCAAYGPIDSFNAAKPGAVWSNNRYDDGTLVVP